MPSNPDTIDFRLIVTGSRHWEDQAAVDEQLDTVLRRYGPFILRVGDCPTGADKFAVRWAGRHWAAYLDRHYAAWDKDCRNCPRHRVPKKPDDVHHPGHRDTYCPAAGPRRNQVMVAKGADLCIAFVLPGSRGTRHTVELARAAGIPVILLQRNQPFAASHAPIPLSPPLP